MAPNGEFLKEGDTLYQFQLATTLEAIAEQGIDYFYNSNFTVEMVTELQQKYGSIITVEDFQKYTAIERQVVAAKFKDYIMLSMPPPACGAILGLILNILDGKFKICMLYYIIDIRDYVNGIGNRSREQYVCIERWPRTPCYGEADGFVELYVY